MPRYDFRCAGGHVTEELTGREVRAIACPSCPLLAERLVVPSGVGITGLTVPPIGERRVHLGRAIEAQHEIVDQAQRAGVEPPDLLSVARRKAAAIRKHAPEVLG